MPNSLIEKKQHSKPLAALRVRHPAFSLLAGQYSHDPKAGSLASIGFSRVARYNPYAQFNAEEHREINHGSEVTHTW